MYIPREVIEKRLWDGLSGFLEYMARRSVIIVVGSYWPLPLIMDKWLADVVALRVAERGFWPIILADEVLYRPLYMIRHPEAVLAGDKSLVLDRVYNALASPSARSILTKLLAKNMIVVGAVNVLKAIDKGDVKLVILAKDTVNQAKITAIKEVCSRRGITVKYIDNSKRLGEILGFDNPVDTIAVKGDVEDLAEVIGEKTLLDLIVKYGAPIIAIGSCFANRLVCDVAREGSPQVDPYGGKKVAEISQWRGIEIFMVYGREPEETRDLILESIPKMLEWLEGKYGDRKIELARYVDLEKLFAPIYGGPWVPSDVERLFEEYQIGTGQVDTRLLVAERAILIVVPTLIESELWERRWAYRLVWELKKRGFWGVVVTDKYLFDEGRNSHGRVLLELVKEKKTPIISIGDPVSNRFTKMIEEEVLRSRERYGDLWLLRGNIVVVE